MCNRVDTISKSCSSLEPNVAFYPAIEKGRKKIRPEILIHCFGSQKKRRAKAYIYSMKTYPEIKDQH